MFKGNLSNLEACQGLPVKMFEVIEQVKQRLSASVENGRYQLEGDDVFFFVVDDNSKLVTECPASSKWRIRSPSTVGACSKRNTVIEEKTHG